MRKIQRAIINARDVDDSANGPFNRTLADVGMRVRGRELYIAHNAREYQTLSRLGQGIASAVLRKHRRYLRSAVEAVGGKARRVSVLSI